MACILINCGNSNVTLTGTASVERPFTTTNWPRYFQQTARSSQRLNTYIQIVGSVYGYPCSAKKLNGRTAARIEQRLRCLVVGKLTPHNLFFSPVKDRFFAAQGLLCNVVSLQLDSSEVVSRGPHMTCVERGECGECGS